MINRRERLISFLVVWLTMFSCFYGWGQIPYTGELKKDFSNLHYPGSLQVLNDGYALRLIKNEDGLAIPITGFNPGGEKTAPRMNGLYVQPANLYYLQSGFFCKREWELEKITHIPFRLRLGSLAECNALEGKH
jgi:hypothetical protein